MDRRMHRLAHLRQHLKQRNPKSRVKVISFVNFLNICFIENYSHHEVPMAFVVFVVHQPVVQQLKTIFDDVRVEFQSQDSKLDAKIDTLISLHKERLDFEKEMQKERMAFEREKLNFKREKAGLPRLSTNSAAGESIQILDNVCQYVPLSNSSRICPWSNNCSCCYALIHINFQFLINKVKHSLIIVFH